jgi:acetoin:2,6-dichlorophenolindophenol oxidoreductase subunit alpha
MPNDRVNLNLQFYKKLYLIRTAENLIVKNYPDNEMKTPTHMSLGEEATVVGVCHSITPKCHVVGYYRSHALFLAMTNDTDAFFGEMYGKVTGIAKGKSGSMHLASPEHNLLCVSAVVASTIPLALGIAYANRIKKDNGFVISFFGDGAMDAGVFWESLNFACLKKLPVLFVCRDNDLAIKVFSKERQGFDSMIKLVGQYNCVALETDTTDVEEIHNLTRNVLFTMKSRNMPGFLRLKCYRYLEHSGINEDFDLGYRSRDDFNDWRQRDPVSLQRRKLIELSIAEDELAGIEKNIDMKVRQSLELAKKADYPDKREAYKGVYYGK